MTESSKRRTEAYCWYCNDMIKDCVHYKNKEQRKLNKFLNWVNYGGNSKTGVQVIDNHYTQYGRGYQDAIGDVFKQLIKTLNIKGLREI